ncbi:UBA6-like protein [Mya arenaria]|uniref:UBA6-like protein n=1 Tax=Mya arenaria TaxID=6604 RepID=A0ABY7DXC6_MYAAR|nr:UBA6-like protein [Mya arenaria]
MQRMAKSSILVYGMGAKNIVLAGVKSVTVQDPSPSRLMDLGTQFFIWEEDVQKAKNRAEASSPRLSELNPYVSVNKRTDGLTDSSDLQYLTQFQCVIMTEVSLTVQVKVNNFCRANNIKFISADVFGVFSGAFCDFGDSFEVSDPNGEEPKDVLIKEITKGNPGVLTTLEETIHGFETDDTITFKEIGGMTALNGTQCKIKVLSPTSFSICVTSGFTPFTNGGVAVQECLETQLKKPDILVADFSKFQVPGSVHAGFIALHKFQEATGQLPDIWNKSDASKVAEIVSTMKADGVLQGVGEVCERTVELLSYTCRGSFLPLCAALGGIVAQEGLKAVTGKGDRYDQLRICVGDPVVSQLHNLKLFMVGCGAIGCEMLKNYALLGIGTAGKGQITITDNDLIEKSNLNRQFLFRPQHIRQPKSTTAAQTVKLINPALRIVAQQHKVCVETEKTVYTDAFFEDQDLVVNALDNVEARRYVDSRIVTARRSLLESGTMGTKGHTQVIVAHLTESYSSQRDPPEQDVPYCTLKSFPRNIDHCIQWARSKFESSFAMKPNMFNKFWSSTTDVDSLVEGLENGECPDGAVQVGKLIKMCPQSWAKCLEIARLKFEKYFNHRSKNLLHAFPLDQLMADGTPFWQAPRRPPKPIEFNLDNPTHMLFVLATARLYADNYNVTVPSPVNKDEAKQIISAVNVPQFVPSNKKIETDESKPSGEESASLSSDETKWTAQVIRAALQSRGRDTVVGKLVPAEFEKDDDSNGHIDFITAASNLRASMYHIEEADRLTIKRIAGKIVPAIATTTAAVSGLVTVELVKVVCQLPRDRYRNCFLNLALPLLLLSEPGPAETTTIREGLAFTNWDIWEVQGGPDFTLQNLMDKLKEKVGSNVTFVSQGARLVYMAFLPAHKKRLTEKMSKLLKGSAGRKYEDLVVSFESDMDEDDIAGPPIRYFF